MSEYVSALFTLTRIVLIMNSIMHISIDKRNQIDLALINQFLFSPLIHEEMEMFMEPTNVAKL